MKIMFLITWRQWLRGGAKTWFTMFSALVCATLLSSVQFGGASLAQMFYHVDSFFYQLVAAVAQILNIFLILCLAILLKGTFSITLAQRTRMLGQLSSIGATRRQLRQSVWFDAIFLSVFSAPLGILCAIVGLSITFRLITPIFESLSFVGISSIHLVVTPEGVLLGLFCPLITLLLAASLSAIKASRLSPIEAVKGISEIPSPRYVSHKEPKEATTLLALRNIRRVGGRFRSQVTAIVVCTALVMMVDSFSNGLLIGYKSQFQDYTYQLYLWVRNTDIADLSTTLLQKAKEVTSQPAYLSENTTLSSPIGGNLVTLDDETFEEWYGSNLSSSENNLLCIYAPGKDDQSEEIYKGMELTYFSGQTAILTDICENPLPVGIVAKNPYVEQKGVCVTSQSIYNSVMGTKVDGEDKREIRLFVDTNDSRVLTPALTEILDKVGAVPWDSSDLGQTSTQWRIQDTTYYSKDAAYKRGITTLLTIFVTGFQLLVIIGCTSSLFSSILAESQLRRRELALLRSNGMTQKQISKMLAKEMKHRYLWGLGIGLPIGICVWFAFTHTLLGDYTFVDVLSKLFIHVVLLAGIISACTLVICWIAKKISLKVVLSSQIRRDLMQE